jgi:hypothetical protein
VSRSHGGLGALLCRRVRPRLLGCLLEWADAAAVGSASPRPPEPRAVVSGAKVVRITDGRHYPCDFDNRRRGTRFVRLCRAIATHRRQRSWGYSRVQPYGPGSRRRKLKRPSSAASASACEKDVSETDQFGRLRRLVWTEGTVSCERKGSCTTGAGGPCYLSRRDVEIRWRRSGRPRATRGRGVIRVGPVWKLKGPNSSRGRTVQVLTECNNPPDGHHGRRKPGLRARAFGLERRGSPPRASLGDHEQGFREVPRNPAALPASVA